jgi:hypothetical protein
VAVFWCADLYAIPDYLFAGSVQFMLRAEISILIDLLKYIDIYIVKTNDKFYSHIFYCIV